MPKQNKKKSSSLLPFVHIHICTVHICNSQHHRIDTFVGHKFQHHISLKSFSRHINYVCCVFSRAIQSRCAWSNVMNFSSFSFIVAPMRALNSTTKLCVSVQVLCICLLIGWCCCCCCCCWLFVIHKAAFGWTIAWNSRSYTCWGISIM